MHNEQPAGVRGRRDAISMALFVLAAVFCLSPWGSPPVALAIGVALALTLGNPFAARVKPWVGMLLRCSVVLLGFGMDLHAVLQAGADGAVFAACTIVLTLVLAVWTGRWLGVEPATSTLVGSGTAICGGSAIAAVSGVIRADHHAITVSMGTIFVLNAVALLLFPPLGHAMGLTQEQFGTWAGVAIHDVSSVVGAAQVYGGRALEVATAVKLSRTLWIIPICLVLGWWHHRAAKKAANEGEDASTPIKLPIPWFIGFFVLASVSRMFIPVVAEHSDALVFAAKKGLTLTLFLIGAGFSRKALAQTGWRPMVQGVLLWLVISGVSLGVVFAKGGN